MEKMLPGDPRRKIKSCIKCLAQKPSPLFCLSCGGENSFIKASVEPQSSEDNKISPIQDISIIRSSFHPDNFSLDTFTFEYFN